MVRDLPIKDLNIINLIKQEYIKKKEYRNLLFFLLSINTGLKIVDLLSLKIRDIKNKDYLIVKQCKNEIIKRIPLNKEIQEIATLVINDRLDSEPIFISRKGRVLDRISINRNFTKLIKNLGLNNSYTAASLRRTFGYHYYQKTKDLSFLQWLFNQTTVTETMKYIDVDENINFRFDTDFYL